MRPQKGSVSFTLFVLALSVGMVGFALYLLNLPLQKKQAAPAVHTAPAAATEAELKMAQLQGELFQLYTAMDGFESMRNSSKYLEIAGEAGKKLIEADDLWEEHAKARHGAFDGMIGGIVENYEGRFTSAEKLEMLGKKYGISPDKLRLIQAELEIMFSSDLAEKYAGSVMETAEEHEAHLRQENETPNPENPATDNV